MPSPTACFLRLRRCVVDTVDAVDDVDRMLSGRFFMSDDEQHTSCGREPGSAIVVPRFTTTVDPARRPVVVEDAVDVASRSILSAILGPGASAAAAAAAAVARGTQQPAVAVMVSVSPSSAPR